MSQFQVKLTESEPDQNTQQSMNSGHNYWGLLEILTVIWMYRKVSNIRCTKCQNLNDSRLVLQLFVPNPLKPSVKSIMKM